jgi:hypothetical protein
LKTVFAVACLVVAGTAALACVPCAQAWCNGPSGANGFGTHDWILKEAARLAARRGAGWLRVSVALPHTDDPDTVFHDYYYHVYDQWGGRYGGAPQKVAEYYRRALAALRAGDRRRASVLVGIMAHYYGDVCNPLHTDQCDAEERIHSAYESMVQDSTDRPGENRAWLHPPAPHVVSSVYAATVAAAVAGHRSYARLVSGFSAHGMNRTVRAITQQSLNRAVSGLADLIAGLAKRRPAGTRAVPLAR